MQAKPIAASTQILLTTPKSDICIVTRMVPDRVLDRMVIAWRNGSMVILRILDQHDVLCGVWHLEAHVSATYVSFAHLADGKLDGRLGICNH